MLARLEVLGRTQRWLATQTGISTANLNKMLKQGGGNKRGIEAVDAWRIARATGLTAMYILYGNRDGLAPEVIKLLPPED